MVLFSRLQRWQRKSAFWLKPLLLQRMLYAFSRKNKVFYKISGIDRYPSSCLRITSCKLHSLYLQPFLIFRNLSPTITKQEVEAMCKVNKKRLFVRVLINDQAIKSNLKHVFLALSWIPAGSHCRPIAGASLVQARMDHLRA